MGFGFDEIDARFGNLKVDKKEDCTASVTEVATVSLDGKEFAAYWSYEVGENEGLSFSQFVIYNPNTDEASVDFTNLMVDNMIEVGETDKENDI